MPALNRCERKHHRPYEGMTCPECKAAEERAAMMPVIFGILAIGYFVGFISAWFLKY